MRIAPFGLVRPLAVFAVGLTGLAILLGRNAPEQNDGRRAAAVRDHSINWYLFRDGSPTPRFFDAESGQVTRVRSLESERLEYVSCSPWRDTRGQAQVVGLWNEVTGRGDLSVDSALGLARFTFPEGQVLDRIHIDIVPNSVPCWYPGTGARVLFSASDGRIYHVAFEEGLPGQSTADNDLRRPRPLSWTIEPPGRGTAWISDPSWPSNPRLSDRIILVSVLIPQDRESARTSVGAKLWWLELNAEGTAIVAAGPIAIDERASTTARWPVVAMGADGRTTLAYLVREEADTNWRLRVAPVTIDPSGSALRAGRSVSVSRDGIGLDGPPVFSPDGRWVHVLSKVEDGPVQVERYQVDKALGAKSEPALVSRTAQDGSSSILSTARTVGKRDR